jgi:pimeloyl-ACP methyl ester carboxylesterase
MKAEPPRSGRAASTTLPLVLAAASACAATQTPPQPQESAMNPRNASEPQPIMPLEVSGRGPGLVLVGGGLTGALSWAPHAERLAPARTVARAQPLGVQLALDERPLPAGYGVRMESAALVRALDARGFRDPIDVVGWSYGGLIALDLALEHPARIRSLTLIEPSSFWVLPDHGRGDPKVRALEATERAWARGVSEDDLAAFLIDAAIVAPGESPRAHPRWPIWVRHRQALAAGFAEFDHRDDPSRLRAFRRPVLLVAGEGTAPYFRLVVDALARELPRGRVVELPGGHVAPLVAFDRFLDELAAFHDAAGAE